VELVPLGPYKYHLKVFCKKAGIFTKVLEALCSYNAQVTSMSTITFYGYAESVFCIEVNTLSKDFPTTACYTDLINLSSGVFQLLNVFSFPECR